MLRYNPMPNGPLEVDWYPTPIDGLVHVASMKPFVFPIGLNPRHPPCLLKPAAKWQDWPQVIAAKNNMLSILSKLGATYWADCSWFSDRAPSSFHTDGMANENSMFLMSMSLDLSPNLGTLFRDATGYIWQAETWHLYLVDPKLQHSSAKMNCGWKILFRFVCTLPFEV